jgi:predicted enzyme related to lactoylglutathione lyase
LDAKAIGYAEELMSEKNPVRFECANPILRVEDMAAAVKYYVEVLGFKAARWGSEYFTSVYRDRAGIYLCKGGQGNVGTWAWVGVEDAAKLYEELQGKGAKIHHPPRNYPWALEMHVEDYDGNVLRFGSEPDENRPWEGWKD